MDLLEALARGGGMVCLVGAGGKKTAMYRLARRFDRAAVTATVRIPIFDSEVSHVIVTDDPVGAAASAETWPIGVVPEREREDRYRGYELGAVDELVAASVADVVLVKADGARMRLFKAPGEDEPRVPRRADTVIPVASVHVVGKPLSEQHVHRVERVAEITGREPGETVEPEDVATVLASEHGGRKGVPEGATAVPLVNMVDDDRLERTAREIAAEIHERADVPRVVLAQMIADEPVVDVVG